MKKILFLVFVNIACFGQINITFPFEKSVFQRNTNNIAKLDIAGNFSTFIDKVEARLTPVTGGVAVAWTIIQTNPQNGLYKGSLDVQGGWYTLEVRGSLNGQIVGSATLARVGVGEVFLIAGQSNAQGLYNNGAVGANDERVVCVNNYSNFTTDPTGGMVLKIQNFTEPTLPTFESITANSTIAPMGRSAWCWGKLGDLLTQRLNVPVLFFNVALEGQNIANWKKTADGQNVLSPWNNSVSLGNYPYLSMKTAINYYLNTYGVRSVLWHQGEADSYFNTPQSQYINDLQFVINKSRTDLGKNIPWAISQVSYQYGSLNSSTTNAQNQVISNTNLAFFGPNTDGIQIPRPDGVHFSNQGLIDLASAWDMSLDQAFFANAIPVLGTSLVSLTATCNSANTTKPMTYTGVGAYSSYNWSNGDITPITSIGTGTTYLKAKDAIGNVSFSHTITNNSTTIPAAPIISASGPTAFCIGGTVTLNSNYTQKNTWSTGANTNTVTVANTGSYTTSHTNSYGCTSKSIPVSVVADAAPNTPTTDITGVKTSCASDLITLKASGGSSYIWNTGQTTESILVNSGGVYSVKAVSSGGGCNSLSSADVTINYKPIPAKPVITTGGNTSFCADKNVVLTSSDVDATSYLWNNGATTKSITVTQTGSFSVKTTNVTGCNSISSEITTTQLNPLPTAPIVTANGSTTICDGDNVVLQHNSTLPVTWSTGAVNVSTIAVTQEGTYSARSINSFGCLSLLSNTIPVMIKALPAKPTISSNTNPSFCANQNVVLTSSDVDAVSYLWNNGATTKSITITQTGNFNVKTTNTLGCNSVPSASIVTQLNPLPTAPVISANSSTTICDGENVILQHNSTLPVAWSTGAVNTPTIAATQQGTYSARSISPFGCFSLISNTIPVIVKPLPAKPLITTSGNTSFCTNQNVVLTSSEIDAVSYLWSNGATTKSITVTQTGDFSVKTINVGGCVSNSSGSIITQANPLPIAPVIIANSSTTICDGDNVVLQHNSTLPVAWSTGSVNTPTIAATQQGTYSARSISTFGCLSLLSNTISITVKPAPIKPTISINGSTSFCIGKDVVLTSSDTDAVSYLWSNGAITKSITVTQTGIFSVKTINIQGCTSLAAIDVITQQNPLPTTPIVSASGFTTLCQGEISTLKYNSTLPATWSTGATTATLPVSTSGAYTARVTDAKGCISLSSAPLIITFKSVPAKPTIKQIGSFTLQADPADPNQVYEWKYGSAILPIIKDIVKSNNYGIYTLRGGYKYTRPEGDFLCYSESSSVFDFNNDPTFSNALGVYPNPSIGTITVETQQDIKNAKVTLYRVDGAEIFTNTVSNFDERKTFDLGIYGKGVYIIRVKSADFDAAKKIIIE